MRLNSTGVAEALPSNARDRKATGSSLKREMFFSIIGILGSTLDRVARYGIEFLVYFRKTRELKVDYLHVCVNLILFTCLLDMTDTASSTLLTSKAKEIVYYFSEHFMYEGKGFLERTAEATGVGRTTVV